MKNKQAHEEAAGMNLDPAFFASNNINPDDTPTADKKFKVIGEDDRSDLFGGEIGGNTAQLMFFQTDINRTDLYHLAIGEHTRGRFKGICSEVSQFCIVERTA